MSIGHGGCLRKVDAERLGALLHEAGFAGHERHSFLDAEVRSLPKHVEFIATTTDLIYDFGSSPLDFGHIAVAHALSDLHAVLATPLVSTIALGIPPAALNDGTAAAILRGYRQALHDEGVEMGGGHTVYASDAFVGITAVGLDAIAPVPSWSMQSDWVLLLSKPLGSGICITARAHHLGDSSLDSALIPMLRQTNALAASELRAVLAAGRESLAFVTDVTGFGLLFALSSQLRSRCRAQIRSEDVPVLAGVEELIETHGMATILGEHSMICIDDDPAFSWDSLSRTTRLVLTDPQTSGGLLTAVSRRAADSLRASSPGLWTEIGTVHVSTDEAPSHVTVI